MGERDGDFRSLPKAVLPEGLEGFYFVDGHERTEVCIPNAEIGSLPFKIIHHFREFTIDTNSLALFIVQRLVFYPYFAAWRYRAAQFIFNRRRLARQDRMAILRYIFEKTVEKSDFRTSNLDLPVTMYGMRFYGRDDHSVLLSYYV
jgi:hypothetical protein